jgi:hypothetical protein
MDLMSEVELRIIICPSASIYVYVTINKEYAYDADASNLISPVMWHCIWVQFYIY